MKVKRMAHNKMIQMLFGGDHNVTTDLEAKKGLGTVVMSHGPKLDPNDVQQNGLEVV